MLDVCHLDEMGMAMTLPAAYSWSPVGERVEVAYEANAGRRLNVIGGYFSHGPLAGSFEYEMYLGLPRSSAKQTKGQIVHLPEGVSPEEVGPIHGERLVAFLWKLAGRPVVHTTSWKRVRPLYIWMDNYSVHKGAAIQEALPALNGAGVHIKYLPAYSPELSEIEPVWNDVKYHEMTIRSSNDIVRWRNHAKAAHNRKGEKLLAAHRKSTDSLGKAA